MSKAKQELIPLNGDESVAYAVRQCDVDVVVAYPITPQTIIVERFSEYVHNGEVDTEFVCAESEHSALTCCLTAALVGARTFTATCGPGLALMHEMLGVTAGYRAPVVMAVSNRALSAPINIHCDHSDTMAERDSGWIQIYVESAQEAYDSTIQAFKIAEDPDVLLPTIVAFDGFVISHMLEGVYVLTDEAVKSFIGERRFPLVMNHEGRAVQFKLDPENPITIGALDLYDYYFEHKRQQEEAAVKALEVIRRVHEEYAKLSGRRYGNGLVEPYRLEDADIAIVCLGSTVGAVRTVVNELRLKGIKAGLLKVRTFRPFPAQDVAEALKGVKAVAVMDRGCSFGGRGGPVFHEVRSAFYDLDERPRVVNYIYGLGGRDTPPLLIRKVYDDLNEIVKTGRVKELVQFLGLRE